MLTELHINNIAIARAAVVEPGAKLTVITGETGAGKSILLDALGLVLGDRADTDIIRHGEDKAEITARFELAENDPARRWLIENDMDDDGEVLLRRVIHRERASKGYINGRPAPAALMRELGEQLVDIHGQHAHQSLLKTVHQRQMVDQYAGIEDDVAALGKIHRDISQIRLRLTNMQQASEEQAAQLELLQFQVNELEAAAVGENEVAQLDEEHKKLANASKLLEGVQAALWSLYDADEGSVNSTLSQTVATLQELAAYDPALDNAATLLSQAQIELDESVTEIRSYQDKLELDPNRLQWVEQRLQTLLDLSRKHRVDAEQLPQQLATLKQQLGDIENADANLEKLQQELAERQTQYDRLADAVSAKRQRAAEELSAKVSDEIRRLGLGDGQFVVQISQTEPAAHGRDLVEFLVSANPGQPPRLLNKVASGGELSRISLAIQVVTARINQVPTQIFDEVDVGIGGGIAEIVGQQLRELARNRQVICITHLAQVAAQGHTHIRISKSPDTGTTLENLNEQDRVEELSRMIGGMKITDQTRAHASELLGNASL